MPRDALVLTDPWINLEGGRDAMAYMEHLLKTAGGTSLGDDASSWPQDIINEFNDQHPFFSRNGSNPNLNFTNKDWVNGCSIGTITLAVKERLLVFPVVIRNQDLATFDIYYDQSDRYWHYASSGLEGELLDIPSIGNLASTYGVRFDGETINRWSNLLNNGGLSGQGNVEQGFAITASVNDIAKRCNKEALAKVAAFVEANPDRIHFTGKKTAAYIMKLVEASRVDMSKAASSEEPYSWDKEALGQFERAFIRKNDLNLYDVMMGKVGSAGPVLVETTTSGVREIMSKMGVDKEAVEKILNMADAKTPAGVLVTPGGNTSSVVDTVEKGSILPPVFKQGQPIKAYGQYLVQLSNGNKATGTVLPVYDWDGDKSPMYLFVCNESWSLQPAIYGSISSEARKLPESPLTPESSGSFVYEDKGVAFTTPPIKIEKVYGQNGSINVTGIDLGSSQKIHIVFTDKIRQLVPFDMSIGQDNFIPGHRNVFVPVDMKYTQLPSTIVKVASAEEAVKKASFDLEVAIGGPKGSVRGDRTGWDIIFPQRTSFFKLAHSTPPHAVTLGQPDRLATTDRDYALFMMKNAGVIFAEQALDRSKEISGPIEIQAVGSEHYCPGVAAGMAKMAEARLTATAEQMIKNASDEIRGHFDIDKVMAVVTTAPRLIDIGQKLASSLTPWSPDLEAQYKLAADLEGQQSLDALFGLSLLSNENIKYLVSQIGFLDKVEDFFAKLLLLVRLTNLTIEESALHDLLEAVYQTKKTINTLALGVDSAISS